MGEAQVDDTLQPLYIHAEPPAINNTNLIAKEVNERDLVLHIGDISYAIGYAGVVRLLYNTFFLLFTCTSSLNFYFLLLVFLSLLCSHSCFLMVLISFSLFFLCHSSGTSSLISFSRYHLEYLTWCVVVIMKETTQILGK